MYKFYLAEVLEMITEPIDQALKHVIEYLAISDLPQEADAIFLFGNYTLSIPEKGAQLFHSGYAPLIVADGLRGHVSEQHKWDMSIAEKYASYLLAAGIPSNAILIASNSTNTLEDVLQGVSRLIERNPNVQRLIITIISVHQRRAFATLCQHYPDLEYVNIPVAEDVSTSAKKRGIASRAVGETHRLQRYAEKGDTVPQNIPSHILHACETLSKWVGDDVY